MDLIEVSSILDKVKKKIGLDDIYFIIMSRWEQEVGNNKIILNGFKNGIVFASTMSATYLSDFNLRKRQIITKLNQYIGKKVIKNIKCEIK